MSPHFRCWASKIGLDSIQTWLAAWALHRPVKNVCNFSRIRGPQKSCSWLIVKIKETILIKLSQKISKLTFRRWNVKGYEWDLKFMLILIAKPIWSPSSHSTEIRVSNFSLDLEEAKKINLIQSILTLMTHLRDSRRRRVHVVMSSFNRDQTQKTDESSKHTTTKQQEKECCFDCFDTAMKFTVNCELGNLIYTPSALSFSISLPAISTWHLR